MEQVILSGANPTQCEPLRTAPGGEVPHRDRHGASVFPAALDEELARTATVEGQHQQSSDAAQAQAASWWPPCGAAAAAPNGQGIEFARGSAPRAQPAEPLAA
jgi:hypothetical protein